MAYELFGRICVGTWLRHDAVATMHREFATSLGVDEIAEQVFAALRDRTARHKLHEPDRFRYERALEEFVDARWNVDCALGGLARDGLLDANRGYLYVGVRVEQFDWTVPTLPRGAADVERPQLLRKGDLSAGSELLKSLGEPARKAWAHASRAYSRAGSEIVKDATARLKSLPVRKPNVVDWALCRWAVDAEHPSVVARHGRER